MTTNYTTPITAIPGNPLPDTDWNAGVRDSMENIAKPPRIAASKGTDQSIPNATVTAVSWAAVGYDSDGFWSAGSPTRLTVPAGKSGLYLCTFQPIFDLNATGGRFAGFLKNGSPVGAPVNNGGSASWYYQPCLVEPITLNAGDYIEGSVYQTSGGALNLKGSVYTMIMTMMLVARP